VGSGGGVRKPKDAEYWVVARLRQSHWKRRVGVRALAVASGLLRSFDTVTASCAVITWHWPMGGFQRKSVPQVTLQCRSTTPQHIVASMYSCGGIAGRDGRRKPCLATKSWIFPPPLLFSAQPPLGLYRVRSTVYG
jgi:hypothetical protein